MPQPDARNVQIVDIAPGLWIWRLAHPSWSGGHDPQQVVTGVCVDTNEQRWVIDPLLPPKDAAQVWDRLNQRP